MRIKDRIGGARTGMTLIEVMMALMLLSVGIMGVADMIDISMLSNRKAQGHVEDTIAAAMTMEQILALHYDDPRLEDRDDGFFPKNPDHGPVPMVGRTSTIEWEVDRQFPAPNTKRIQITVRNRSNKTEFQRHRYDYVKTRNLTFMAVDHESD